MAFYSNARIWAENQEGMFCPRTIQEHNSSETKDDRYAIYLRCARDLGWQIKSYDEWLNS